MSIYRKVGSRLQSLLDGTRWHDLGAPAAALAENPRWVSTTNCVFWIDVPTARLHVWHERTGAHNTCQLSTELCAIAARTDGQLVVAEGNGLNVFDPQSATSTPWCTIAEFDTSSVRVNDAAWASDGSLWLTTMSLDGRSPLGSLYRVIDTGDTERLQFDLVIGNGPAFDHRLRRAYLADSPRRTVFRIDEDTPTKRTPFAQLQANEGFPDGMAVDANGNLWVAHYDGACISVWSPYGTRMKTVHTPFQTPTALVFLPSKDDKIRCVVTCASSSSGSVGALWLLTVKNAFV